MIEELMTSLHLGDDSELKTITCNYFLEVSASKVINFRPIETKVACCVLIAAKKKGFDVTIQQILRHSKL